jgi:AmmeMemoRadiSam system protein A
VTQRASVLARWARARVREALGGPAATPPTDPWCGELGATFVTLRWRDGDLQGCIGTLEPERSLVQDVARNAVAAATRDPRGEPLAPPDLDDLHVELSILSPLEPLAGVHEIRVGIDGVVLQHGMRRATFLPVMWEHFGDLGEFLAALKHKAGLPHKLPDAELTVWRYTVEKHVDAAPSRP